LGESSERGFLIQVIKELLNLCELRRGKDNKAIVAANIMYVVGQYCSFLRAHWRFLKTVCHKLFEFMHENHPGVQEMAVETLLRITLKCAKKFANGDQGEGSSFLESLLRQTADNVRDLLPLNLCTYFESLGLMIAAAPSSARQHYVDLALSMCQEAWVKTIHAARSAQHSPALLDTVGGGEELWRGTSLFLRLHERIAGCVGLAFTKRFRAMYLELLEVYHALSRCLRCGGTLHNGKQMRKVRQDILRLIHTYRSFSTV